MPWLPLSLPGDRRARLHSVICVTGTKSQVVTACNSLEAVIYSRPLIKFTA